MIFSVRFFRIVGMLSCMVIGLWGNTVYAAFGDTVLKYGMQGEDVATLQTRLSALGYAIGVVDGYFGNDTLQAVKAFQADAGMEPDGVVGEGTFERIGNSRVSFGAPVSRGMSHNLRSKGAQIAAIAQQYLHVPYVWGGSSPAGFDCSGFIYYLFSNQGFSLPRMADEQFEVGQWVDKRDLLPGDLVFFETYEVGASHVGVYMGGDSFIHASSAVGEVTVTPLSKPYYAARYLGARRVAY